MPKAILCMNSSKIQLNSTVLLHSSVTEGLLQAIVMIAVCVCVCKLTYVRHKIGGIVRYVVLSSMAN